MEGLEINELLLSQVRLSNEKLRIDSGYFSKPILKSELLIRAYANGFDDLGLLFSRFIKGIFEINSDAYVEQGIPFLRILNLRNSTISEGNLAYIPHALHLSEKKTELRRGDIVLSKTAYPAASLVTLDQCNTSQDTIATTFSDYGKLHYLPEAVVAYLNCAYGDRLLWRQFQGNVQLHLGLEDGRKVPIPRMSMSLQKAIKKTFDLAIEALLNANNSYSAAEALLIKTLGLASFLPSVEKVNVKSLSESFGKTGRLDAEYYQPKYDRLLKTLGKDGLTIGSVAPARHDRFQNPGTGGFEYIEIGGMRGDGTVAAETVPCAEAPSRASQKVRSGDIVTSTVRPIRRLSALILEDQDDHVCSSGFVVLQPKHIAAEVLLVYLRLPVICELMDLHTSASLYPAISEKDLLGLPMPKIALAVQQEISTLVRESFTLKLQSQQLLEAAKRAVEIAIEQDEAAGMAYLAREISI